MKTRLIAATAALLMTSGWSAAQTTAPATAEKPAPTADRPAAAQATPMVPGEVRRTRGAVVKGEKEALEQKLKAVKDRAGYAKALEDNGYRISSINADKKDYLEYEVVKGDHSYEVQLDFKDDAPMATKVDVTTNMWRTDATKAMLKDAKYKHAGPLVADPEGKYSDRRYMKGWTDEKEQLEKMRTAGMTADQYMAKVKERGYQVTSVNDKEADYVEYEILKGDNSYEVQLDLDPKSKVIKEVDVAANAWDASGTEKAKDAKEAAKK